MITPEQIAGGIAAIIAIGAGLRKAKGLLREDTAVNTVVDLLRSELTRTHEALTALRAERDALSKQIRELRAEIEQGDRAHHECRMALNKLTYQLEKRNASPDCERPTDQRRC